MAPPSSHSRAAFEGASSRRYSTADLSESVDAHERFVRGEPQGRRAIWRYIKAPGCDLAGRLLSQADLTGANLSRARLVRANLDRACLHMADLREVDAAEASFKSADIRGVSLRQANLADANFDDADMRQAVLSPIGESQDFRLIDPPGQGVDGTGGVTFEVDFTHCSMRRVRLTHARLSRANFSGAFLIDADLDGADLRGVNFKGAVLTGAKLDGAKLDPDAFVHSIVDPSERALRRAAELIARLDAADQWVVSDGDEGAPADLDDEDLRPLGGAFVARRLTAISARRVCAISLNFSAAQLQGGRFDDADLRDADFTGADLRGASFRGAKLRHARFDRADLRPLPLASGGVREVDLTGADYARGCFAGSRQS